MDLKKSDVVEERVRESCSAEGKVKGKVKSVNLRKWEGEGEVILCVSVSRESIRDDRQSIP